MTTSQVSAPKKKRDAGYLLPLSLMLFSMFFGAGNLIFPPVMGWQSGTSFTPAVIGFLIGGVVLPIVAIITVAISGTDAKDLALRAGRGFSTAFAVVAYLSIGAFYALPRTGAVSFSTAVQPITGWDSPVAGYAFNAIFFGGCLLLAYNPNKLVDNLGKILTPLLLILLAILVVRAVGVLDGVPGAPVGTYAHSPLAAGMFEGYMTMDSVAGLAFGIIVINSLRYHGVETRGDLIRGTSKAGLIAGFFLACIYVGLALIGRLVPNASSYPDGAALLSSVAHQVLGLPGQIIFGLIVLLACVTTAVGLFAASGEFFNRLIPSVRYEVWLAGFALVSFAVASHGLETMLSIAGPVIGFIYPVVIVVVAVTLLDPILGCLAPVRWSFAFAAWMAAGWSFIVLISGWSWGSALAPLVDWAPYHAAGAGWLLPTAAAFALGVVVDAVSTRVRA